MMARFRWLGAGDFEAAEDPFNRVVSLTPKAIGPSVGAAVGIPVAVAGWVVAATATTRFLLNEMCGRGRPAALARWDPARVQASNSDAKR